MSAKIIILSGLHALTDLWWCF